MIIYLAVLGLILSVYSFVVGKKLFENKNYKPLCEISRKISCSKAFSSKYGKILGIPNSVFGVIFYTSIIILENYQQATFIFILSTIALASSIFLAGISYIKMKNFCLVCSLIYIINILIFICSI